jgi:peptide/nickel transport system ATP-binding protein
MQPIPDKPPRGATPTGPVLDVRDLSVALSGLGAVIVDRVSFSLACGEVLGVVGESGCGKTLMARSVMGLTRFDRRFRLSGRILLNGRDVLQLDERRVRAIRGRDVAMVFQDPMSSLNPLQRVGTQIMEMIRAHERVSAFTARTRAIALLRQVGIPHPDKRIDDYPHQYSGGMRQRVMIALALACGPALLVADEPTTALDATTQAQILDLLMVLQRQYGMAVILITHDLGIVAEFVDKVLVMYAGQCVEWGATQDVFRDPQHPYTRGLLDAMPSAHRTRVARLRSIPGAPPALAAGRPSGCAFRPRCAHAMDVCRQIPELEDRLGCGGHLDRCWLPPDAKRAAFAAGAKGPDV